MYGNYTSKTAVKRVLKSISILHLGFNFALKDFKCETSLSLLLFIFIYNKLVLVIAGCS